LSEAALRLETSAKDNDFAFCVERFPALRNKLVKLHEELSVIFPNKVEKKGKKKNGDKAYLKEKLVKAFEAASDFDNDAGLSVINDLMTYDFGERNNDLLESAAKAFKDFDFSAATELLNKLK